MKVFANKEIPDVKFIALTQHTDDRGYFAETWNIKEHLEHGLPSSYAQDNLSKSCQNTLRGIHFQIEPHAQGKLVGLSYGSVFDVAVDLRPDSPTFKKWVSYLLTPLFQLYIPPGFGHGFLVVSTEAMFTYKCTANYSAVSQHSIRWDDPELNINWPIEGKLHLSEKDKNADTLNDWILKNGIGKLEVEK